MLLLHTKTISRCTKTFWYDWNCKTSSEEFFKVYGLEVIEVPTNKPIARIDGDDLIYQTELGKFKAISKKIKELNQKGQPSFGWYSFYRKE